MICVHISFKTKQNLETNKIFSLHSDSDVRFEVMINNNIKLKPTLLDEYCAESLFFDYGPVKNKCSDSAGYDEFNKEEKYSFVNMFTFTYETERDTRGGYFFLEIRGKLFM